MQKTMATALAARLDELGLAFMDSLNLADLGERDSIEVTVTHAKGSMRCRLVFIPEMTGTEARRARAIDDGDESVFVLGPQISERSAALLRQLGVNYLDQAGNAFIDFDGVHIDVRGRRDARAAHKKSSARVSRESVNLFSTKRAQVVFVALSWPRLLERSVRDIASRAAVSVGQAQETLELLTKYAFLDEQRRLLRRDELIDLWAAAYPAGLGALSKASGFSGALGPIDPKDARVHVSGEGAVPDLLRPESVVVYADAVPVSVIRDLRWRRDDDHPNILFRRRFWIEPQDSEPGLVAAPPLLVYADLLASNDGRQREAARAFRESHDGLLAR